MSRNLKLGWIILIMFVVASASVAYGLISTNLQLHSFGDIKTVGIGVYWDNGCSQNVSSIDWGLIEPGSVKNVTVYIRNEGNAPVTLYLQTVNWYPSNAPDYISLSWNYSGQTINPNQVVEVTFSLSISPNIQSIRTFTVDIIISATG